MAATSSLVTPQREVSSVAAPSYPGVRKWGAEKRSEPRPITAAPAPIHAGLLPVPRPP